MTVRIAMWSTPRTVSTALMRSFGARSDTVVVDEPLYAHFLAATGRDDPGRSEVLAAGPTDWCRAVDGLLAPVDAAVQYQKHIATHLLPSVGRDWLRRVTNAYLIREPARVVASYAKVRGTPTLADLGYERQASVFRAYGGPVIDAADLLADPPAVLAALCGALGIAYDPAMLSWPAGPRPTDGVWAPYWYSSVLASTGFAPATSPEAPAVVPGHLRHLVEEAEPYYAGLAAARLR